MLTSLFAFIPCELIVCLCSSLFMRNLKLFKANQSDLYTPFTPRSPENVCMKQCTQPVRISQSHTFTSTHSSPSFRFFPSKRTQKTWHFFLRVFHVNVNAFCDLFPSVIFFVFIKIPLFFGVPEHPLLFVCLYQKNNIFFVQIHFEQQTSDRLEQTYDDVYRRYCNPQTWVYPYCILISAKIIDSDRKQMLSLTCWSRAHSPNGRRRNRVLGSNVQCSQRKQLLASMPAAAQ